jgi:hypothetical protein
LEFLGSAHGVLTNDRFLRCWAIPARESNYYDTIMTLFQLLQLVHYCGTGTVHVGQGRCIPF